MRFIIFHKTNAHWEAGGLPGPKLIARVGALIEELTEAGGLEGAEGLRPSSEGVRLRLAEGVRTETRGPFKGDNELPAGFDILRAASLDEAIRWATRLASVLGDGELEIRPVTEAWDIGLVPKPPSETTRRYMVLRKATAASEEGAALTPGQRSELAHLVEASRRTGVHLTREDMRPSSRGRRYKNSRKGISVTDGPFTESKELIAGYVIVSAPSLEGAERWALRYIDAVGAEEVDVRELEDR